jgi:hypothetical protein
MRSTPINVDSRTTPKIPPIPRSLAVSGGTGLAIRFVLSPEDQGTKHVRRTRNRYSAATTHEHKARCRPGGGPPLACGFLLGRAENSGSPRRARAGPRRYCAFCEDLYGDAVSFGWHHIQGRRLFGVRIRRLPRVRRSAPKDLARSEPHRLSNRPIGSRARRSRILQDLEKGERDSCRDLRGGRQVHPRVGQLQEGSRGRALRKLLPQKLHRRAPRRREVTRPAAD